MYLYIYLFIYFIVIDYNHPTWYNVNKFAFDTLQSSYIQQSATNNVCYFCGRNQILIKYNVCGHACVCVNCYEYYKPQCPICKKTIN